MPRKPAKTASKATKKTLGAVKGEYTAELRVSNEVTSAAGSTLLEALDGLAPKVIFKGKSILTVRHGDRAKESIMYPFKLRMFVANSINRQILAKRLSIFL